MWFSKKKTEEETDSSDDETLEHQSKACAINYIAAIYSAIGSFLFGYDSGIIGSVISEGYTHFWDYFKPTESLTGAIVSVFAGGAFFGALVAGQMADRIGRKYTIQVGSAIGVVGCVLQTAAVHSAMLIVGRLVAGFSIGILSMIVPVYQSEISPPHVRGLMSGWTQLMISWGFFVANWVGYGCQYINGQAQWRVPLGIQIAPAVLLFLGMFLLPFSPRWLASQGRTDEAHRTLVRLHGGKNTANLAVVEAEFQAMLAQIEWEREHVSNSYWDLVKNKPNLHRTAAGCLIQAMCQWTGVNVNQYYFSTIYSMLGFNGNQQLMISGINGAVGVVETWVFIQYFVDRMGRRWPLIIGSGLCAVCMAWQTACNAPFSIHLARGEKYVNESMGISGIASTFVFGLFFSFSFGPISWTYQSEIFPMHLRALGTSVSTASNWLNNVIIAQITPIAFASIGYKYFLVYVCTSVSNTVVCYFLFPETKGKTLEEIGLLFGDTDVHLTRGPPTDKLPIETPPDAEHAEHAMREKDGAHIETVEMGTSNASRGISAA